MAKHGSRFGFVSARVNANVESRAIIADELAIQNEESERMFVNTYTELMYAADYANAKNGQVRLPCFVVK